MMYSTTQYWEIPYSYMNTCEYSKCVCNQRKKWSRLPVWLQNTFTHKGHVFRNILCVLCRWEINIITCTCEVVRSHHVVHSVNKKNIKNQNWSMFCNHISFSVRVDVVITLNINTVITSNNISPWKCLLSPWISSPWISSPWIHGYITFNQSSWSHEDITLGLRLHHFHPGWAVTSSSVNLNGSAIRLDNY